MKVSNLEKLEFINLSRQPKKPAPTPSVYKEKSVDWFVKNYLNVRK
jgi:hypothetical protein